MIDVPPGYVLAAWVIASGTGETESAWLYRHEDRWHVRQETLVGKPVNRYDVKLLPTFRRKGALRVAQEAVDALQASMVTEGLPCVSMRVDLGTKDREKLLRKIRRSPLGKSLRLAKRNQKKWEPT